MGIRENILADGGRTYTVELRYAGGEAFRATYDSLEEASKVESEVKPKLQRAARAARSAKKALDIAPAAPLDPVAQLMNARLYDNAKDYLARKKIKSTMKRNGQQGAGWDGLLPILEAFAGDACLNDVKPSWAEDFVGKMRGATSKRKREYSYATINKVFGLLKASVNDAAWRLNVNAPKLPFETRRLFPKNWGKPRDRIFRPGEEEALRKAIDDFASPTRPHWHALLTLAIATGARLQELVLLRWDEVHIPERFLWVDETNNKTEKSREVPLSPTAVSTLVELEKMRDPSSQRVFHLLGEPSDVSKQFCGSIKPRAGIDDFRLHDLRHVAATRMRDKKGADIDSADVAKILGHSPEMLQKVYDHNSVRDLADRLP